MIKQLIADANGIYQANLSPGIWHRVAAAQGYQQDVSPIRIEMVANRGKTHDIELVAQAPGPTDDPNQTLDDQTSLSIHGRIFGQDESGEDLGSVTGATIELSGSASGSATTDENGFFLFETVKPGDITYRAAASGHSSQTAQIRLSATSGTHVLDLILTKGTDTEPAGLTGQVVEAVDDERRIVPHAVIKLDHLDFPSSFDRPVDSVAGKYVCEEMEPGRWRATVTAAGFKPYVHDSFIEIPAGQSKEQDFVLERVDPNAERDSTHSAIVSVETTAETEGLPSVKFVDVATGAVVQGEVHNDGAETDVLHEGEIRWQVYTVYPRSALSAGDYQAVAELGSPYEDATNGPLRVEPEESTIFNLTLRIGDKPPKPALLAGLVVEEVDGERTPIPTAVVELVHLEQSVTHSLPVANASGRAGQYVGRDLIPGQWRVLVSAPGFKPNVAEAPISLTAGEKKRKDFVLQRGERESSTTAVVSVELSGGNEDSPQVNFVNVDTGATVTGVAEDYGGDSAGGWRVLVYYPERKLPAGDYRAEAMQTGHIDDASSPQAVTSDTSTVFNLTLRVAPPERALLAGGVFERVGGGLSFIPGAVVKIIHLDSPATFDIVAKETGSNRYVYRSEELTPGRWRASVSAGSDFDPYVHPADIILRPSERKRQDFVLTRRTAIRSPTTTAVVSMELTTENMGTPHVQFVNVESGLAIDGTVNEGGGELLQDEESDWQVVIYSPVRTLPPGNYRAEASQRGFRDDSNGPKPVDRERSTVFDLLLRPVAAPQTGAMWVSVFGQYGESEPEQISDALITLLNEETGERRQIAADESGVYYASRLDAGQWKVSARIEGVPAVRDTVTVVAGHESECDLLIKVQPPELFVIVGASRSSGETTGALRRVAGSVVPQVQLVDEFGDSSPTAMRAVNPEQLANIGVDREDLPEGEFRWFAGPCSQVDGPGRYFAMAKMAGYERGYSSAQEVGFGQRRVFFILLRPGPAGGLLVKVEDVDRQPLADATVSVADASGNPVPIAWNNEVNAFLIERVSPGQFSVAASAEGWDLAGTSHQGGGAIVQDGQLTTVTYTFKRPPPPRLVVRVERKVDGSAAGIVDREIVANAQVIVKPASIQSWTSPWNQPLQQLQDGNYFVLLNSIPPSGSWDYSVEVNSRRGEPERGHVMYRDDGGPMLIVLEPLPPPAPLLVKVLSVDEVDISEPVSGATVFLKRQGTERPIRLTQVEGDEEGLYRLEVNEPMPVAQWEYAVKAPDAEEFVSGQVTITPGEVAEITIKSEAPLVPSGPTVLLVSVYKNRNRDPADRPFLVKIENQTEGEKFRLRNMKGKGASRSEFEEQLTPGNFQLTVTVPGLKTWGKEIVLKKGLTRRIDFYLEPPTFQEIDNPPNPGPDLPVFSGRVLLEKSHGVQITAANATVYLRQGEKGKLIKLTTDTNGEFVADDIVSGMWQVVAELNGQRSPIKSIDVNSGLSTECSLVVTEPPPQAQSGRLLVAVLDQNNRPLADASVLLKRTEGGDLIQSETSSNGKCQIDSLESGAWQVVATFKGASSERRNVSIHAGTPEECNLTIVRSVSQDPVEQPSNPLQGEWNIVVYRDLNDRDGEPWGTISVDVNGEFLRQRFDGGAPTRGSLKIVDDILEMGFGGRPEPVSFRPLGDGRFEVGGFTWEPRRSGEPRIVAPRPIETTIPANLSGGWNIVAPKNEIDRTMSLWGTIAIGQDGTYRMQPRGEEGMIGNLKIQDGYLYLEERRLALRAAGEDQILVGEMIWERPARVRPQIPVRPEPDFPAARAIPAALLGGWDILAAKDQFDSEGYVWGTIDISRNGSFIMQPREGQTMRGQIRLGEGQIFIDREQHQLQSLGDGRFQVGDVIWVRRDRNRNLIPQPPFPAEARAIPDRLVGVWNIREFQGPLDETGFLKASITVNANGTFFILQSGAVRKQGSLSVEGPNIRVVYNNGERPALLPINEVQDVGFMVGDQLWERERDPVVFPPP